MIDGGGVHVMRHVRPVVATDFANAIVQEEVGEGLTWTRLRRPIGDISMDSNVVEATGREGRSAPAIAIEKGPHGRIFYQDVFTELQTLTEFTRPDPSQVLGPRARLVERFVSAFRFLNRGSRVEMPPEVPTEQTPLRVGHYVYSAAERMLPLDERLLAAEPGELQLSIAALGRGTRSLRDHDVDAAVLEARSRELNGYTSLGFEMTENLLMLERIADMGHDGRRRAAVMEAVSIREVALLQARDRLPAGDRAHSSRNRNADDLTLKALVNTVLPYLLRRFDGDPGPLVKCGNRLREIRNAVVHTYHEPSPTETDEVLSTVHTILAILELPDRFKANWKARADDGLPRRRRR